MILILPLAPSVNAAYANVPGHGRVKTRAYRNWLKNADAYFLTQKRSLVRVSGPMAITIRIPQNSRMDASNVIKLTEDYLVSREITGDDKHNWRVTAERSPDVKPGFCAIEVRTA